MEVSRRLRSCVRHSDQVMESSPEATGARSHRTLEAVARLGGDEFVALLPEVADERDAERVAERILDLMREPILVGGQECFVTASVGMRCLPARRRYRRRPAAQLRRGDVLREGGGRNPRRSTARRWPASGREKLELESALHKAIERNELVLHYQPKIDVRGARMVGAEALMRWQRGGVLVPPGDFIPLAEETGLIIPMSEWAIREAARQARIWQDSFGFADSIAVNLPNRLFERTDLVELHPRRRHHLRRAAPRDRARDHRNRPDEGPAERDPDAAPPERHRRGDLDRRLRHRLLVARLPDHACRSASSRSTAASCATWASTPQSTAVVTAIIALARSLGLRVVAEGVENLRQMEVLHRLGCGMMQGFLFSRRSRPKPSKPGCGRRCCRARRRGSVRRRAPSRLSRP